MTVSTHLFSVEEYHRLVEAGGFDEEARIELIEGVIADMSPRTRAHDNLIEWLTAWLFTSLDQAEFRLRVQSAMTLSASEPEPDLAVIARDAPQPYHPATATLVIEVAVSSRDHDLTDKPRLYAAAGVEEYWVVDLGRRSVIVHRAPRAGGYEDVDEIRAGGGVLSATALALPALEIDTIFAAAS